MIWDIEDSRKKSRIIPFNVDAQVDNINCSSCSKRNYSNHKVQSDCSTISTSFVTCTQVHKSHKKVQSKKSAFAQSRKNYYCYVNNCIKGYKYLSLFKYHLAGHEIFHFDCDLCNSRFDKFLPFKKHFKDNHQMSINDYKVTPEPFNGFPKNRRAYVNNDISEKKENFLSPQRGEIRTTFNEMLLDLFLTFDNEKNRQNDDFVTFDTSILQIRNPDFPSFCHSITS